MPKLLNRKQHRKSEVQFCCHRASAHVFWSVSIEQVSLIPSHNACFDYFLPSHLSLQPMSPSSVGLPQSILLHQAVVMPKPEIAKRKGQIWSKLVLSGRTLLWKKIPEVSSLGRLLPTNWYVPEAKRWWAHPLLKGQWLTAQPASLALGLNLLSLVIKLKLLFLEALLFIS